MKTEIKELAKVKFKKYGQSWVVDATQYRDGIGCTITELFKGEKGIGLCFDFPAYILPDLIESLEKLKDKLNNSHKEKEV
jgi:hypothetical protein